MPKTRGEETKKQGDPLEPLIDGARDDSSPRKRKPEEDRAGSQDDED